MLNMIDQRLQEVKSLMRKKAKWELQLEDYERELKEKVRTVAELKERWKDENHDVEKLEKLSLTKMLATLAGTKEDRLRTEKKEAVAAKLKYDEAEHAKAQIEQKVNDLKGQLASLPDVEKAYNDVLLEKEEWIRRSNSPIAEQLAGYSEQIADLQIRMTELQEAIEAGESVQRSLKVAIDELDDARDWGTFDMLGGGFFSTAMKHDHMDNAKQAVHDAQAKMRAFQKELLDVDQSEEWAIDLSSLLTFADYFFDGIITDWFVQERIHDSLDQAERQAQSVDALLDQLQKESTDSERILQAKIQERNELLENTSLT